MQKLTAHLHPGLPENLQLGVSPAESEDAYYAGNLSQDTQRLHYLGFQNGPIAKPQDINGWTNEALLAVLIHRISRLNVPPYNGRENALAITKLEEGLMWLHQRTTNRLERKVEVSKAP